MVPGTSLDLAPITLPLLESGALFPQIGEFLKGRAVFGFYPERKGGKREEVYPCGKPPQERGSRIPTSYSVIQLRPHTAGVLSSRRRAGVESRGEHRVGACSPLPHQATPNLFSWKPAQREPPAEGQGAEPNERSLSPVSCCLYPLFLLGFSGYLSGTCPIPAVSTRQNIFSSSFNPTCLVNSTTTPLRSYRAE